MCRVQLQRIELDYAQPVIMLPIAVIDADVGLTRFTVRCLIVIPHLTAASDRKLKYRLPMIVAMIQMRLVVVLKDCA